MPVASGACTEVRAWHGNSCAHRHLQQPLPIVYGAGTWRGKDVAVKVLRHHAASTEQVRAWQWQACIWHLAMAIAASCCQKSCDSDCRRLPIEHMKVSTQSPQLLSARQVAREVQLSLNLDHRNVVKTLHTENVEKAAPPPTISEV